MAESPIRVAAAATAGLVTGTLLETIVKRFGFVLNVGETLGGFDFAVGEPPLLVHYAVTGYDYFLDTTDSTTPDDGLTCLVSGNGLRFHIEDAAAISRNSVLSIETAPPGAPVVGDVYRVGAAATGDFAGHDDDLAVWTRRGWVFATPEVGLTVFNEDTETNQQFTASGWTGFAVEFANQSVPPRALLMAAGIAVESTENTPPGSPAADTFWLVGTVPTRAFVGHAGDIAFCESAAWAFIDAYEGATVFHKDFGFLLHYVSGAWLGGAGSDFQEFNTAGGPFTWTKPAKGNVALIQVWGAGGSGGRGSTGGFDAGGGGGGGAYVERLVKLADLGATENVTVGAGGPARTTNNTSGVAGGNSSFGTHVIAYGGAGGEGGVQAGGGGGGGGQGSAGAAGVAVGGGGGQSGSGQSVAGGTSGGSPTAGSSTQFGGGGGGGGGTTSAGATGGASEFGGGGGGGAHASAGAAGGAGGKSMRGGGGGGGGVSGGGVAGAGGMSLYGGNGGAGSSGTTAATAGGQPGGGGGGTEGGTTGKGGDGRVRVTVW